MTTPRTALEECLRLAEMATPGEWECSEHDFPLPPFEGALEAEWGIYPPLGEAGPVAITAGEYNARAITAAVNILRTHSKALSEALDQNKWPFELVKRSDVPEGQVWIMCNGDLQAVIDTRSTKVQICAPTSAKESEE